jgi:replicative DNA helicase
LGGLAHFPERLDDVGPALLPDHFYRPVHQVLFGAMRELITEGVSGPLDHVLLLDRCRRLDPTFPEDVLGSVLAEGIAPHRQHADIIIGLAAGRQVLAIASEAQHAIAEGDDAYQVAARAAKGLDEVGTPTNRAPEALTVPQLVERADQVAPWVVPGLLRLDWRAVIVAGEGKGKSTLLRQLAIAPAQGIHPLKFSAIPPVNTLVVDAENSLAAIAETGGRLDQLAQAAAGERYDPGRCRIWSRPGGLDLRDPRDRSELVRELKAQRPQLVVAGPVYKLGRRRAGEAYEEAAEGVQQVLDDLRTRFGFALVLEHHAPKGDGGAREMAPFGSQRWLAWPELGLGLYAERDNGGLRVERFRGDRMAASWPDKLVRGQAWPFEGVWRQGLKRAAS